MLRDGDKGKKKTPNDDRKRQNRKENAEDEFRKILEKCIQIVQEDTSPLEAELRATSNPVELVGIFDKIVIKKNKLYYKVKMMKSC